MSTGKNATENSHEEDSLQKMTREELLERFLQLRKDYGFLERDKVNLEAMYHEALSKERAKSRLEKETLERTAMDIFQAVGELSEEKTKAEKEKKIIESSAMDIAQAVGELSQEKTKVEEEKRMIESSAMDIAHAVGEISEEKTRVENEKHLIETSAMDIIKNLTELSERQAQELKGSFVPPPMPAVAAVGEQATGAELKAGLQKALEHLKNLKNDYKALLQKIYPAHFLPVLENRETFLPSGEATVLIITITDYYQHLVTLNSVRLARFIKKLSCDIQGIIHQYGGWVTTYNHNNYHSVFGDPQNPRSHPLEAAQAAVDIMKYGEKSGFKLSVRLHTGAVVLGDFGSPERPQYHCLGELLAYMELMKKAEQAHPQSIILTEQIYSHLRFFFESEKLEPVSLKGHGVVQIYRLGAPMGTANNPNRVDPAGALARRYPVLAHEIAEKREVFFKGWNFEKIEVRDGSLGTGAAIALYAIAFAREQNLHVNEDLLLRCAFLLNIGKMSIPKAVLNNPSATAAEKKQLGNLYNFTLALLTRNPNFRSEAEVISAFRSEIEDIKKPEALALKVAAAFEGISFPKLYKTTAGSLKQAVNIYRNAFTHPMYVRFLDLMKPK